MAYLRPPRFVQQVFNPLAMRLGVPLGLSGTAVLTVRRRRSGRPQQLPVIPVDHDGARHVVSTRGDSEWVRNVRAAGTCELRGKDGTARYVATEVPVAERGPIIEAYRAKAGRAVTGYWRQLPDPVDHPVFRLAPAGQNSGE